MINHKQQIVRKQGAPVILTAPDGTSIEAVALVGRASKQFNNTVSLESHRKAQLLPSTKCDSGYLLTNKVTGEKHVCVSTYNEVLDNKVAVIVTHMLKCNGNVNVSSETSTADGKGNIKKVFTQKHKDVPVYAQKVTAELRLLDPGLLPDVSYVIYSPPINVELMDNVDIFIPELSTPVGSFKVAAVDKVVYPGAVMVQLKTETRK